VKTSNVLLTREGSAKVADVGLATMTDYFSSATACPGTFMYVAPEVLLGRPSNKKVSDSRLTTGMHFLGCVWQASDAQPAGSLCSPEIRVYSHIWHLGCLGCGFMPSDAETYQQSILTMLPTIACLDDGTSSPTKPGEGSWD